MDKRRVAIQTKQLETAQSTIYLVKVMSERLNYSLSNLVIVFSDMPLDDLGMILVNFKDFIDGDKKKKIHIIQTLNYYLREKKLERIDECTK